MQLQISIEDILQHKLPMIGVQFNNPVEKAIRRAFNLFPEDTVAAYANQATIWFNKNNIIKGSWLSKVSITINYSRPKVWQLMQVWSTPSSVLRRRLLRDIPHCLSLDCCPSPTGIFKNIIPKSHLKDFYKYCED